MRQFLHYLKTNKWYKHQKHILITKKIDIYTARFEFKENKIVYRHINVGQASTIVEKIAIVKQKTVGCEKAYWKTFDIFTIDTWQNSINNIMFLYK